MNELRFAAYDRRNAERLLRHYHDLDTFAEAREWDQASARECQAIDAFLRGIPQILRTIADARASAIAAHKAKSFFARLFSSPNAALRECNAAEQSVEKERVELDALRAKLESGAEQTPNDAADKKAILEDLRNMKRDLAADIREAKLESREQHREAKQAIKASITGGTSKAERLAAYLEVEGQRNEELREIDQMERRKINIDRTIAWVTRFR